MATRAKTKPKNAIIHEDAEKVVRLLDDAEGEADEVVDGVTISRNHVEMIKAILILEEEISFRRESISELKKALAKLLDVEGRWVNDLIGIVKKEMNPEKGGDEIQSKTLVLDAAEQCVVMYPNVEVKSAQEVLRKVQAAATTTPGVDAQLGAASNG